MARKRSRKPKIVGTMVVDGKEIPVIGWLGSEKMQQQWRKLSREEDKELEREWQELWREMRKAKPFSLLELFVQHREVVRQWETEK